MKKVLSALALAALSSGALAGTATGDVSVTINYTPGCELNITKSQVTFDFQAWVGGNVDPATFNVRCSAGVTPLVALRQRGDTTTVGELQFLTVTDNALSLPYIVYFTSQGSGSYAVNAGSAGQNATNLAGCPGGLATCSNTASTNNVFEVVVTY